MPGVYSPGMDRIWQWAWDRYARRFSWALCAVTFLASVPIYLLPSVLVVAFERSSRYVEAAALTIVTVPVLVYVAVLPGVGPARLVEQWAADGEVDRASALAATYAWSRGALARTVAVSAVWAAMVFAAIGAIAGAPGSRLVSTRSCAPRS